MSKNNNVVPDHFKTRGREPQGQDVPHEVVDYQFGAEKAKVAKEKPTAPVAIPGTLGKPAVQKKKEEEKE